LLIASLAACTGRRSSEADSPAAREANPPAAAPAPEPGAAAVTEAPAVAVPAQPTASPKKSTATSSNAASTAAADGAVQQQAARDAVAQEALAKQKAINAEQTATNARLQQEVDRLKPREYTLPAGTAIAVRPTRDLTTAELATGGTFEALLDSDLTKGDVVLAKAGSRVTGVVVEADKGGKVKGTASLTVGVRSIVGAKSNVIAVHTDSYTATADSTKKKDAVRTGVATGVGAVIGGIAGGGKGAAIGAGAGAAAGVGTNMATRGAAATIPAETLIELKLVAPVTVVIQPQ
jgi:hypothetical protein